MYFRCSDTLTVDDYAEC